MPRRKAVGQASIHDVARAAGVSLMTVSRSMRGVDGVSEATRTRVLTVAQSLKYMPNSNARALAMAGANLVGITLPTLFNEVFADILLGMRRVLKQAGYVSIVDTTDYSLSSEGEFAQRLLQWRPAAMILTGVDHDAELRSLLKEAHVRVLELWEVTNSPIDLCVGINHGEAGRQLGQYLCELGYRRPAFVGTPPGRDPRADKRVAGLREAFADAGADSLVRVSVSGDNAFVMGAAGYSEIDRRNHPDVVLFLNDHMAFGGMMQAEKAGYSVPKDFGVVGFNGLGLTQVLARRLTTIETPRYHIGLVGARNLIASLNGVPVPTTTELPCKLVAGETTRPQ